MFCVHAGGEAALQGCYQFQGQSSEIFESDLIFPLGAHLSALQEHGVRARLGVWRESGLITEDGWPIATSPPTHQQADEPCWVYRSSALGISGLRTALLKPSFWKRAGAILSLQHCLRQSLSPCNHPSSSPSTATLCLRIKLEGRVPEFAAATAAAVRAGFN